MSSFRWNLWGYFLKISFRRFFQILNFIFFFDFNTWFFFLNFVGFFWHKADIKWVRCCAIASKEIFLLKIFRRFVPLSLSTTSFSLYCLLPISFQILFFERAFEAKACNYQVQINIHYQVQFNIHYTYPKRKYFSNVLGKVLHH